MVKRAITIVLASSSLVLTAGDWPQWLGPTRDARVKGGSPSLSSFPPELKPMWKIAVGGGFSSPVVSRNRLVYFDENGTNEVLHCVDASTGQPLWQTPIGPRYEDEWGAGPRSTPFIDDDRVYAQSCTGEFRCLSMANGKVVWSTSFAEDFGVKFLGSKAGEGTAARRGNNGSGIIDGPGVIVPVGSTNGATLVCFDKLNGTILWRAGNDEAAYSSVQVASMAGRRQVIYLSADALAGFDRADGNQLWHVPLKTGAKRHAATPVIAGDHVVVNSHTFGTVCYKVSGGPDSLAAKEVWRNKDIKINLATPAHTKDLLFSQGPKKDFVCVDAKTGDLKWSQAGFGKDYSSTIVVGENLLTLTDQGELVLISASSEKYTELGRAQVCGKTWSFPALVNGRIYIRDAREVACYSLVP